MPGSHAEEIVGDYSDPDDWAEQLMDEAEAESEPDLDLPPLPPPMQPRAAGSATPSSPSTASIRSAAASATRAPSSSARPPDRKSVV